jgi:hypothetical protein
MAIPLNDDKMNGMKENLETVNEELSPNSLDALQEPKSACVSPASSNGGIYSVSLSLNYELDFRGFCEVIKNVLFARGMWELIENLT